MSIYEILITGFYQFPVFFVLLIFNPLGIHCREGFRYSINACSVIAAGLLFSENYFGNINLEEFVFGSFILIAINLLTIKITEKKGGK